MRVAVVATVAVIVLASVMLYFRNRHRPKEFKSTDEYVQWAASLAVNEAEQYDHEHLDYSVDSIKTVEKILGKVHEQYAKDPKSIHVAGLANEYGAYIGEVIRRSEPGSYWLRDDEVGGPKSYPIVWRGKNHSYVMGWCYRRIVDGEDDNLWIKYIALKEDWLHKGKAVKQTDTKPQ
jgi:hypothetical protein